MPAGENWSLVAFENALWFFTLCACLKRGQEQLITVVNRANK